MSFDYLSRYRRNNDPSLHFKDYFLGKKDFPEDYNKEKFRQYYSKNASEKYENQHFPMQASYVFNNSKSLEKQLYNPMNASQFVKLYGLRKY